MTDFTGAQIFICGNHSVSKALSNNILNCDFFHNAYQRKPTKRDFSGCNTRRLGDDL